MTDVSDGGRVPVLRAVLRLWDDLRNGVDAEVLGRRLDETARRAVGGHLETGDGRLCAPSELRRQVVEWLRPRQPAAIGSAAAAEFGVFLVSWGLSIDPEWVERWRETGSPRRSEPGPHLARAVGWGADRPARTDVLRYDYLAGADLFPDRAAGKLVDAAVERLLNATTRWGEPKHSRLEHDMRQWLREAVGKVGLFDTSPSGAGPAATREVTRLAVTMAAGATLGSYVSVQLDVSSQADEAVRAVAAAVLPHWSDPPELHELRRLCVDYDILAGPDGTGSDHDLGVEFADFRAVFRTFASKARDFRGVRDDPERHMVEADPVAFRRLAVMLDLAVADVRDGSSAVPRGVESEIAELVRQATELFVRQHETSEMLELQRLLRDRVPAGGERRQRPHTTLTYLERLLTDLSTDRRHGRAVPSRSDRPAGWRDVNKLVTSVNSYLKDGHERPEQILKRLAADMPAAVTALTSGRGGRGELELDPAEARWRLLIGAGDALAKRPDVYESVIVAGSFAELGWVVANEHAPAPMRMLSERVQGALRASGNGRIKDDLSGVVARVLRARPLADSKHANFDVAQRAAHESVAYGTRALREVMVSRERTVHRIVAALTGLQLSLLQAGGVFVRSAETELIVRMDRRRSAVQRQRHAEYIRDLATTSYTYINLAVARLHDIEGVVRAGLLRRDELNYPDTAAASTAAMAMRTLLLWATMQLSCPDKEADDVRKLVPSIPEQFRQMLALRHLNRLNFADMTRIAIHYALLSGDFGHPAAGARKLHPDTPPHLRPAAGGLDLNACGRYLVDNGFDTGILDVLEVESVRNTLNETSGGRFDEWRANYVNPKRRTPTRFRRGDISHVATRLWDSTVGW